MSRVVYWWKNNGILNWRPWAWLDAGYRILASPPVISCIFTTLFYMIISRWNQFTHMLIDIFFSFQPTHRLLRQQTAPRCRKELHYLICSVATWRPKCHFVFLQMRATTLHCLPCRTPSWTNRWSLIDYCHNRDVTDPSAEDDTQLNKLRSFSQALITQFVCTNLIWCGIQMIPPPGCLGVMS